MKQSLILIRGLPGSGKSTLASILHNGFEHLAESSRAEADDFFYNEDYIYSYDASKIKEAHEYCQKKTKNALFRGDTVIVSNTFVKRWEMEPYKQMALELNIPVQEIVCKGPFRNIHNVPEEVIERMRKQWEE